MPLEPHHIATGQTADIYSWEGGQVLKLLKEGLPADLIEREARHTQAAYDARLPAPHVGGSSNHGGRFGWLFERIDEPPPTDDEVVPVMVRLHAQLHGTQTTALPDLHLLLQQHIRAAPLADALKQRALLLLEHLPDGDVFCHWAFHPGHILGNTIIDWTHAARGHALADVARTLIILGKGPLAHAYLKAYCAYTHASREAIIPWVMPVAAASLALTDDPTVQATLRRVAGGEPIV